MKIGRNILLGVIWLAGLPFATAFAQASLPPDPGEAGKATLAGIDSDGNGVRDDVQRHIALAYPDSVPVRAALTQMAKAYLDSIQQAEDENASYNNAHVATRATECLWYVMEEFQNDQYGRKAIEAQTTLRAVILNTRERSLAYVAFNGHLNGQFIRMVRPSERKSSCRFNPDTLPD